MSVKGSDTLHNVIHEEGNANGKIAIEAMEEVPKQNKPVFSIKWEIKIRTIFISVTYHFCLSFFTRLEH